MSTLQSRLSEIMQTSGLSVRQIAAICGVTSSAVTQWKEGYTKSIKPSPAAKLAAATGFNALWIATGEGQKHTMLLPGSPKHFLPILSWEHPDDLPEGEFIFIPLLNVEMSAGNGAEQDPEAIMSTGKPIAFRADWIREMHLRPSALKAVFAHGDSMEPRIQDGDALVVDTSQQRIIDGRVYAIYYEGGERVKRLFNSPGGGLLLRSDNPNYPDILVQPSDVNYVRVIGRVVHIAGNGGL